MIRPGRNSFKNDSAPCLLFFSNLRASLYRCVPCLPFTYFHRTKLCIMSAFLLLPPSEVVPLCAVSAFHLFPQNEVVHHVCLSSCYIRTRLCAVRACLSCICCPAERAQCLHCFTPYIECIPHELLFPAFSNILDDMNICLFCIYSELCRLQTMPACLFFSSRLVTVSASLLQHLRGCNFMSAFHRIPLKLRHVCLSPNTSQTTPCLPLTEYLSNYAMSAFHRLSLKLC